MSHEKTESEQAIVDYLVDAKCRFENTPVPEGFVPVISGALPRLDEDVECIDKNGNIFKGCLIDGDSYKGYIICWAEYSGRSLGERIYGNGPIGWRKL